MRFWISWWGGEGGDPRPNYIDGKPPPFPWWCSGEREEEPLSAICAVIDAENEEAAATQAKRFWPEYEARFCEERAVDYMPNPGRFPPKGSKETP